MKQTHITLSNGINLNNCCNYGDFSNVFFEADLNQNIHLGNFIKDVGMAFLVPKVQLRMFQDESSPVRTPGYLPRLIFYFWKPGEKKVNEGFFSPSIMVSHHSNGQAGNFYNTDGTLNTVNGSFSTNFLEGALNYFFPKDLFVGLLSLSVVWHPTKGWLSKNREENLNNQYESLKMKFSFKKSGYRFKKWLFSYRFLFSYILDGREYIIAPNPDYPAIKDKKAKWRDNIFFAIDLKLKWHSWQDLSILIKYDFGYDYYNIHFREKLNRIRFGFAVEII